MLSCSAAVHGRVPHDLAQWAFIVAAMEAAIAYEVVDPFETEIAAVCRDLMGEDAPSDQNDASSDETAEVMLPFWWPKRQASGPSAR